MKRWIESTHKLNMKLRQCNRRITMLTLWLLDMLIVESRHLLATSCTSWAMFHSKACIETRNSLIRMAKLGLNSRMLWMRPRKNVNVASQLKLRPSSSARQIDTLLYLTRLATVTSSTIWSLGLRWLTVLFYALTARFRALNEAGLATKPLQESILVSLGLSESPK